MGDDVGGDQQQVRDPRHRGAKLLVAIIAVTFVAALLAVALPFVRVNAIVRDLENRGARISTVDAGPDWLTQYTGSLARLGLIRIDVINLLPIDATDADVDAISSLNTVRVVSLLGKSVSEESLRRLASTPALEALNLVATPAWSDGLDAEIRRARPTLNIVVRGPAFLGIAGDPDPRGCRIRYVEPGSPASDAGIAIGDVITEMGDDEVKDFEHVTSLLARRQPDDTVRIRLLRGTGTKDVEAKLRAWRLR